MSGALLMVRETCGCGAQPGLFVVSVKGRLCFRCWKAKGEPAGADVEKED